MSKDITDITEDILLKAGFNKEKCYSIVGPYHYIKILSDVYVDVSNFSCMPMRDWNVRIYDRDDYYMGLFAEANIQTIDHFNKLMELMDIDFRLKEE